MLVSKRGAVDEGLACKHCHGLAVSAVSVGVCHLALLNAELLCKIALETGGVEGSK